MHQTVAEGGILNPKKGHILGRGALLPFRWGPKGSWVIAPNAEEYAVSQKTGQVIKTYGQNAHARPEEWETMLRRFYKTVVGGRQARKIVKEFRRQERSKNGIHAHRQPTQ